MRNASKTRTKRPFALFKGLIIVLVFSHFPFFSFEPRGRVLAARGVGDLAREMRDEECVWIEKEHELGTECIQPKLKTN